MTHTEQLERNESDATPSSVEQARRAERRKSRLWLPFLLPVGAILTVAFLTINISRIFIASSEHSATPAVFIGAGLTIAIIAGATILAAFPDIRTSSLFITLGVAMVGVLLAGSLVLGASEPDGETARGYVEPAAAAVNTLTVEALPTLIFQSSNFDVPGGVNLIAYTNKGGSHTLLFESAFEGFELAVPTGLKKLKADLVPGKKYTIYCGIAGHREAGMEATVTVGAAVETTEPGTATPSSSTPAGETVPTTVAGSSEIDPAQQSGVESGQ
ncbi:MAG: hypothetical protein EXQ69_03005 [Acidimicrobiia bacterium]|nr:hypothetical protein [Acidimicrobiia bacterium]